MTHWIDDRFRESQEHEERETQITNEQMRSYEVMSDRIRLDTDRANKICKWSIKINGNAALHNRVIEHEGRKFHLTLDKETHTISALGEGVDFRVVLGICNNGGGCLKNAEGNEVPIQEASQAILDPFLFPHLTPESKAALTKRIWAKLAQ